MHMDLQTHYFLPGNGVLKYSIESFKWVKIEVSRPEQFIS